MDGIVLPFTLPPTLVIVCLLTLPPSAHAAPAGIVDLLAEPSPKAYSRYFGATGFGGNGVPVAGGRDCDGDGFADAAFSKPDANADGNYRAGEITLVFGTGELGRSVSTEEPGDKFLIIGGAMPNEIAGCEIWMDDVDQDGTGDLLIGRLNYSPNSERPGTGALTVIFGGPWLRELAAAGTMVHLGDPPESVPLFQLNGENPLDRLGIWMRTGDFSGDGYPDIAVGADEMDLPFPLESNRGAVYLIEGGPHLRTAGTVDFGKTEGTSLEGKMMRIDPPRGSAGFHFGATLQLGDLDGNGRSEIVIAATLERVTAGLRLPGSPLGSGRSEGGPIRGRVFVVWDQMLPQQPWENAQVLNLEMHKDDFTQINGGNSNFRFGEELVVGGDYNRDGQADLVVGDLKSSTSGAGSGSVDVFFNLPDYKGGIIRLSSPPFDLKRTRFRGPGTGALLGDAMARGDFDGDGIMDLAMAAPHDDPFVRISAGTVFVAYGSRDGWPAQLRLLDVVIPNSLRVVKITGARGRSPTEGGDTLGYSMSAGDMNGDGRPDLIINEMLGNGFNSAKPDVGNVVVVNGRAMLNPVDVIPPTTRMFAVDGKTIMRWNTVKDYTYQWRQSADLTNWSNSGPEITGDGGEQEWPLPVAEGNQYFQLQVTRP